MTDDVLPATVDGWLTLDAVSQQLDVPLSRVRQFLREGALVAIRCEGTLMVPAAFLDDGALVKGLPGTLILLHDGGYEPDEAVRWLFTPDDSLPGTPIQALRENRGTEVRRRAQAAGF